MVYPTGLLRLIFLDYFKVDGRLVANDPQQINPVFIRTKTKYLRAHLGVGIPGEALLLRLTSNGLILQRSVDDLRDRFTKHHYVVLENLFEPTLLSEIQRHVGRARWTSSTFEGLDHDHIFAGTEFTLDEPVTCKLLSFLLNNPEFLKIIRTITGYPEISEFSGRVYRMEPGPQHHLSWHNDIDVEEKRKVGFSMNLSTNIFHGGTFELRDRLTLAPLAQVNNTGFGDALLFRISSALQHRVTAVLDNVPKTACAGWFRATGKNFFAELGTQMRADNDASRAKIQARVGT